jgi:hypothetical protein
MVWRRLSVIPSSQLSAAWPFVPAVKGPRVSRRRGLSSNGAGPLWRSMKVRESRVFGRRRREAEVEARDAVVQALARLERGLEAQTQAHAAIGVTVQHLHSTVVDTRNDLIETVKYLYEVCSLLIERTESAQRELQAIVETVSELARGSTSEQSRPGERVLGGSFPALPAETVDERVLGGSSPSSADETVDVGGEMDHHDSHWA